VTFSDYLKNRHNILVKDSNQPMLVVFDVRKERLIYLVPEVCRLVGLTEDIMEDRKAYTELKIARRTDAPIKIKEASQLV
jgi:hypothetical protein